jgi:hypothetical protein
MAILASAVITMSVFAVSGGVARASDFGLTSSTGAGSCQSGALCLYRDDDYQSPGIFLGTENRPAGYGLTVTALTQVPSLNGLGDGPLFSDSVQSISNNTSSRWCFYSGDNYTGSTFEIHGGEQWSTLPGYINNNIRSFEPGACPTVIGHITGYQGRCLDIRGGTPGNFVAVDLWGCTGGGNQEWQVNTDGFGNISNDGYCLGSLGGAGSNGTPVNVYQCNGTPGELWTWTSSGQLVQQSSGKCLDDTNWSTSGVQLQIWRCTGHSNQRFSVPS